MFNAAGRATAPSPPTPQSHWSPPARADVALHRPSLETRRPFVDRPTITVVLVSTGTPAQLMSCLTALRAQCERARADLVVVRAGSPVELADMSRTIPGVHFIAAPEGARGQALRRLGMSSSNADIVIVTEDDGEVPAGWVEMFRLRTRRVIA